MTGVGAKHAYTLFWKKKFNSSLRRRLLAMPGDVIIGADYAFVYSLDTRRQTQGVSKKNIFECERKKEEKLPS